MAWRIARRHGLEVIYEPAAQSFMSRGVGIGDFCERIESKGRAQSTIAALHPDDPELRRRYLRVEGADQRWQGGRERLSQGLKRIAELEELLGRGGCGEDNEDLLAELHACYADVLEARAAKGIVDGMNGGRTVEPARLEVKQPGGNGNAASATDAGSEAPELTVTMPIWSKTEELGVMATRTIERVRDVARLRTEIIVIDNGSPVETDWRWPTGSSRSRRTGASGRHGTREPRRRLRRCSAS